MQRSIQVNKINEFTGHSGAIYGLYVSPVSAKVYTGGTDGYIVEWDLGNAAEGRLIGRLDQPIYCIFLFEPSQQLWVGTANGHIHILDLGSKTEIKNLVSHEQGVFDIKMLNGKLYAAGGDGCISMWDAQKMELLTLKKFSDKSARVITCSPSKSLLAVGFSDFSIVLMDENLAVFELIQNAHTNSVFSLAFNGDGTQLYSGGRDAMLKIWNVAADVTLMKEIPAHNLHIHAIAIQNEENYFISSSMDKTIKIWDMQDFTLLKVLDKARNESHVNSINKIAWVNAYQFVSISDDKKLMFWELIS